MKAIILAAGLGKRMKPHTDIYQKSMIEVHGKPLLEYIIEGLIFAGLTNIVIVVGYLKEQVIDYFQGGKKWNVSIEYVEQKELNGTGGALLICEKYVEENQFFLTWGDVLLSYTVYKEVINTFLKESPNFILVTNYTNDPFKGAAVYCENNYCSSIVEKPPKGKSKSYLNNAGVFIFSTEIFAILKQLKPSIRGEIELTDAINYGINKRKWKVRVVKMDRNKFRGDFGDLKVFEQLTRDDKWLKDL
ncbi:MAG: sugar phosphate nucleotidyltransferase [Candidatus Heimdallarchaeota archaeon]